MRSIRRCARGKKRTVPAENSLAMLRRPRSAPAHHSTATCPHWHMTAPTLLATRLHDEYGQRRLAHSQVILSVPCNTFDVRDWYEPIATTPTSRALRRRAHNQTTHDPKKKKGQISAKKQPQTATCAQRQRLASSTGHGQSPRPVPSTKLTPIERCAPDRTARRPARQTQSGKSGGKAALTLTVSHCNADRDIPM